MISKLRSAALLAAMSLAGAGTAFADEAKKEEAPPTYGACDHELLWGKHRVRFIAITGPKAAMKSCGLRADLSNTEYGCLLKSYGAASFEELKTKSAANPFVLNEQWEGAEAALARRRKEVGCTPVRIPAAEQKAMTKALASLAKGECPESGPETGALVARLQADLQYSGLFIDTLGKLDDKLELRPISHDDIIDKWADEPGTRANSADFLLVDRKAKKGVLVVQAASNGTTGEFLCLPVTKAGSLGEGSGWSH